MDLRLLSRLPDSISPFTRRTDYAPPLGPACVFQATLVSWFLPLLLTVRLFWSRVGWMVLVAVFYEYLSCSQVSCGVRYIDNRRNANVYLTSPSRAMVAAAVKTGVDALARSRAAEESALARERRCTLASL